MNVETLNSYIKTMENVFREGITDLTECEYWILHELSHAPNINVLELARRRGRSFQTVARVSYNLQDRGYLDVTVSPDDARARLLKLTRNGRKAYMRATTTVSNQLKEVG